MDMTSLATFKHLYHKICNKLPSTLNMPSQHHCKRDQKVALKLKGFVWSKPMKKQLRKYVIIVCLSVLGALLLDYLSYKHSSARWNLAPLNSSSSSSKSLRVLVVSDPQLVGDVKESWLFGMVTRKDCDWYLYNGYQEALKLSQPDAVLFLGDLLDEGSTATSEQFELYVARFKFIFQTPSHIKQIFIPGDNDIGGDWGERIEGWMLDRFYKHFPTHLVTTVQFVNFITIKRFGSSIYNVEVDETSIIPLATQPIRVFISHLGALDYYHFLNHEMKSIDPHLVLSGHDHWASYISCYKCWQGKKSRKVRHLLDDESVLRDDLIDTSLVYQIVSPTSSYRMGVNYPGYGLLDIDSTGAMQYRVLWLPRRYPLLFAYLVYGISLTTFILARILFFIISRREAILIKK